jgi:hypothetical protein
MTKLLASTLLLALLGVSAARAGCSCRPASEDEGPHGANELIEVGPLSVWGLRGRVLYSNGEAAEDVVVEVYELAESDRKLDSYRRAEERLAACVTGGDGGFCFDKIPPGRYLLVAGARRPAGLNETRVKVSVKRDLWTLLRRRRKGVEIPLTPGT